MEFEPIQTALFVSGSGSNAEAVIRLTHGAPRKLYGLTPALVIADRECEGIERAIQAGVPRKHTHIIGKTDRAARLIELFEEYDIAFAMLLGYLSMLEADVVIWLRYHGIGATNNHPVSLDPGHDDFGGRHLHGATAVDAWLRFARATDRRYIEPTVQLVHPTRYDGGLLVDTCRVPIDPSMSVRDVQQIAGPAENLLTTVVAFRVAQLRHLRAYERTTRLIAPNERGALITARVEAIAAHDSNPHR